MYRGRSWNFPVAVFALILLLLETGRAASLDVGSFSVGGIRIGMVTTDAISALRDLGYDHVTVTRSRCVAELVALHRRVVQLSTPVGSCVAGASAAKNGDWIYIGFEEDLPTNPGRSVVTEVSMTFSQRSANKSLTTTVGKELGLPSATDGRRPWTVAVWCGGFQCSTTDLNYSDPKLGPLVTVRAGTAVSLIDNRYTAQRRSALYNILEERHIRIVE